MNSTEEPDELTPAEHALREQLRTLQEDRPEPSAILTQRIIRTARWQRTLRRPMLLISSVGGAMIDGVRLLLGASRRP